LSFSSGEYITKTDVKLSVIHAMGKEEKGKEYSRESLTETSV
jgi:hypothetical protein